MLSEQQAAELALMKQDNASSRALFQPIGPVWRNLSSTFNTWLNTDGIKNVESQQFNRSFASYSPTHRKYKDYIEMMGGRASLFATPEQHYRHAIELLHSKVLLRDKHGVLGRTDASTSTSVIDVAGKALSWDYLISVDEVISMIEVCPGLLSEPRVVLDLGAGWGRIGHVLKQLNSNIAYIACDIPETLILAQDYLPKTLPSEIVHPYSECRQVKLFTRNKFLEGGGLWFCGTQNLDLFADDSIDVFANIFSFQEMIMQQVAGYFEIINRTTSEIFYTQQRLAGDVMTRENYPYLDNWKQLYSRSVAFSTVYFEAAFGVK